MSEFQRDVRRAEFWLSRDPARFVFHDQVCIWRTEPVFNQPEQSWGVEMPGEKVVAVPPNFFPFHVPTDRPVRVRVEVVE